MTLLFQLFSLIFDEFCWTRIIKFTIIFKTFNYDTAIHYCILYQFYLFSTVAHYTYYIYFDDFLRNQDDLLSTTHPYQTTPSSPLPRRVHAVVQIWPVSIPDNVREMAGKIPLRKFAEFDRNYMPDGVPKQEASATGNAAEHHSNLKRKAVCISWSLSKVFALP
jgi:hypothetical protein